MKILTERFFFLQMSRQQGRRFLCHIGSEHSTNNFVFELLCDFPFLSSTADSFSLAHYYRAGMLFTTDFSSVFYDIF